MSQRYITANLGL